jgi:hypothetical protein
MSAVLLEGRGQLQGMSGVWRGDLVAVANCTAAVGVLKCCSVVIITLSSCFNCSYAAPLPCCVDDAAILCEHFPGALRVRWNDAKEGVSAHEHGVRSDFDVWCVACRLLRVTCLIGIPELAEALGYPARRQTTDGVWTDIFDSDARFSFIAVYYDCI